MDKLQFFPGGKKVKPRIFTEGLSLTSIGDGENKANSRSVVLPGSRSMPWQRLFQVVSQPVCSQRGGGWAEGRPCWHMGWSFISPLEDAQCYPPMSKAQGQYKPRGQFPFHSFITDYFHRLLPRYTDSYTKLTHCHVCLYGFFPTKRPCTLSLQCLRSPFSFLNPQHRTFTVGNCCDNPPPSDVNPSCMAVSSVGYQGTEAARLAPNTRQGPAQLLGRVRSLCPLLSCRRALWRRRLPHSGDTPAKHRCSGAPRAAAR